MNQKDAPVSSLGLQILLFYEDVYLWAYLSISVFAITYKGYSLVYPGSLLVFEVVLLLATWLLDSSRLYTGSSANKNESVSSLCVFLMLSIATVACALYFIRFQAYVFVIDIIVNAVLLIFIILEVLIGLTVYLRFKAVGKGR